MSFDLDGYVLRPARAATGNAQKTDEATTGVDRDHIYPDQSGFTPYLARPTEGPVEPYADMYRAAVLLQPESRAATQEYCFFAATTGSLSTIADASTTVFGGPDSVQVISGTLPVDGGDYNDGTISFYLRDEGAKDISSATSVVITPGNGSMTLCSVTSFDSLTGRVEIDGSAIGGGYSEERGDTIVGAYYILAGVTFWWTRNDAADGVTRFGWDGKLQKWLPLKGTPARSLGMVDPDDDYALDPAPTRFQINDVLPFDAAKSGVGDYDYYALVRVGLYFDKDSAPLKIRVVSDDTADTGWDGGDGDAIVGVDSGVLVLSTDFIEANAGRELWYNAETFVLEAEGDMGAVADLPTDTNQGFPVLSPVPGPTERPFLRIGNRQYLTPVSVATDDDLPNPDDVPPTVPSISTGEFYWSRTTGKIVLSKTDIDRCTPAATGYEVSHLGARLFFDGVAMTTQAVPVKAPSYALDEDGENIDGTTVGVPTFGDLYVKKAAPLPPPGTSGITWVPDGSGDVPTGTAPPATLPQTRPNGSGLVRQVRAEAGDTFFFNGNTGGSGYAYENVDVVEYEDDLTVLKIKVPKTDVEVSRQSLNPPAGHSYASRIQMRRRPVKGDALFFRQTMVMPCAHASEARIHSRFSEPYTLDGTEVLRYAVGATVYTWSAPGVGDYTAESIAASFPAGHAGVERGRLFLEDAAAENIEIGWVEGDRFNLSGHAALGLLPGWKVEPGTEYCWLPDNGSSLGVFRSPVNLDRSDPTPDIRAKSRFRNRVLTDNIPAVPFVTINQPPLEDIPGYEANSHFRVRAGLLRLNLKNYRTVRGVGLKYDWPNDRFQWITNGETSATEIPYPTPTFQMTDVGLVPESVSSEAMLDTAFGLYFKGATATTFTELDRGDDFLLPGDGQPGQAINVTVEGEITAQGGNGTFTEGGTAFSDPNTSLGTHPPGYLLHILNGDAEGVYTFTGGSNVEPPFPASAGGGSPPAQWRIYKAQTRANLDNTLLADVQLVTTNHLPDEPFKIRLITSAGTVGGTLTVDPVDALRSGRITSVRFGLDAGSPEAVPTYLIRGVSLGTVIATGLVVDPSDPHVSNSTTGSVYFQIRIGAEVYTPTIDVGTAPVSGVDVNTTTGEVLIDSSVVAAQSGSGVFYDQLFLAPGLLSAGGCEINAADGSVNISTADASTNASKTAYYVEQMITENDLDVTTSPLNGSVLFNKPLRAGQVVEVNYFKADTNGDKALDDDGNPIEVTEFLALIVRLEEATRVDGNTYTYNPTGRTESSTVESFIWVGVTLQNFAGVDTATASNGTIKLLNAVSETDKVQINYGVLEAFGGEQSYTVSSPPVYRKPFFMLEGQETFTLETDRTADFIVGDLMVLGPVPLYVDAVAYDAAANTTEVTIYPTPKVEVGSRAVGRDAGLSLSAFTVSVSRGGAEGFMPLLNTDAVTGTPLLPADRGQLSVAFYGDVRQYMREGHLLEIGGYPYFIVGSTQSEDGLNTVVNLATPIYRDHDNTDAVRVSVRKVYNPNPVEFTGLAPFVATEDYDLFLLGRKDASGNLIPGKQLVQGVHYTIDTNNGNVVFQSPTQGALNPGEYLHFRYTRLVEARPETVDGALLYPLYKAGYLHVTTPSRRNRTLGKVLRAKYTYRNQDSFYFSVMPVLDYLPEVASASSSQGITPVGGGAIVAVSGSVDLSKQGRFGLRGDARDLRDRDRAARAYISLFNGVVMAFEQVLEALDGRVIGDRDGKFKFFIGRGKRYVRGGWEDQITGDLRTRLIWREVVNNWAPDSFEGWYKTADPAYDPTTAEEPEPTDRPGETDGETPNPDVLEFFTKKQRKRVKNDMDDRLLIGFGRPRGFAALFPSIDVPGLFKQMWEDHPYSRLFPERTKHFTRLFPGLGATFNAQGQITDPGYYTSGRKVTVPGPEPGEETEQTVRTRGSTIGVIANPALGEIDNIIEVFAQDRLPRARVWAFYPNGSEGLQDAIDTLYGGAGPTVTGLAVMVATPLPLSEFPTNPDGFPDFSQLLSGDTAIPNGSLSSLESGDADLSTPAFEPGQRVDYGVPSGVTYALSDSNGNGVFVDEVLVGCVLTFKDAKDATLTGSNMLVNGSTPVADKASDNDGYGDTVFVVPPVYDIEELPEEGDPLSLEENQKVVGSIPDYRIQFDLKVGRRAGEFIDNSLPTKDDTFPLPLQDWFNQNPPGPTSCIEGRVEFANTDTEPLKLPCLLGEDKDDSGDNQIPYLRSTDTELVVLGRVADTIEAVFVTSVATLPVPASLPSDEQQDWVFVYPDEIRFTDGALYEAASYLGYPQNPSTLYTGTDLAPYPDVSGLAVGDVRKFDLMFVQAPQPSAALTGGATGILTVGDVGADITGAPAGTSTLEPPRFVSHCRSTDLHRYTLRAFNAQVSDGSDGVLTTEIASGGVKAVTWRFTASQDSDFAGLTSLVGGGNALVIRYFATDSPADPFIGAVVIPTTAPGGNIHVWNEQTSTHTLVPLAPLPIGTGVNFSTDTVPNPNEGVVTADLGLLSSIVTLLGLTPATRYTYALDLDTYIDSTTDEYMDGGGLLVGSGAGSTTCSVLPDRLTFTEALDLFNARPRGTDVPNAGTVYDIGMELALHEITLGGVAGITVNAPAEINGGAYLSFLTRFGPSPDGTVGATVDYVGTPGGQIRAMAWEGHSNTPLAPDEGIKVSVAPTSDVNETEEILEGVAEIPDGDSGTAVATVGAFVLEGNRNYLLFDPAFTPTSGSLANVGRGDLVMVDSTGPGVSGDGATKEGTYLVRHAVVGGPIALSHATSAFGERRMLPATQNPSTTDKPFVTAGSDGVLDLSFPVVTEAVVPVGLSAGSVTIRGVKPVPGSPTGHGWASSGRVYISMKEQYTTYSADAGGVGSPGWVVDPDSVYSVPYSGFGAYDPVAETLVLVVPATPFATTLKADGILVTSSPSNPEAGKLFYNEAVGRKASGMVYYAIGQMGSHFPANNVVGADVQSIGLTPLQAGWTALTVRNMLPSIINSLDAAYTADPKQFTSTSGNLTNEVNATPVATDDAVVGVPVPMENTAFYEDKRESVYGRIYTGTVAVAGVATYIDLSNLDTPYSTTAAWYDVRFGTTGGAPLDAYDPDEIIIPSLLGVSCLLPGDRFVVGGGIDPTAGSYGFYALEGVFLEPSFPRPVTDLSRATPAVVDATNGTLTTDDIGPRDYGAFDGSGVLSSEDVRFYIRRLRRWHEAQNAVVSGLEPLRYAYEIRRGEFTSYDSSTRVFTSAAGTQLGAFDDPDVNVNAGDVLRVFSVSPTTGEKVLIDTAEVQKVTGAATLKLARPGLTETIPAGAVFEVYLEQAIVPHEQSNEQLFNLITNEVVVNRHVDRSSYSVNGGSVPTVDQFTDTDTAVIASVQEGDYLVIDPAGALYTGTERGQRPEGDVSFPGRPEHEAGAAAPLDDNRGFYRVTGNTAGVLDVTGDSRFSDGNAFGGGSGAEYVVLPIVNSGAEDQQALRVTSAPVEASPGDFSYLARGVNESIQPVAYKVIRPNPVFTKDTVELVLFIRERMLSWIEEISAVYGKGGDYYVFQKDNHITDVGTAGSALSGLGVLSNAVVTSLTGLTTATPFANTADCLSILDRRFWILDFRLDALPGGGSVYTEFADDGLGQRPVLPDLIEEVLNLDDKLRDQRYAWISFRANREDGSIRAARRANGSLERRLRKQREAIARQKALDDS